MQISHHHRQKSLKVNASHLLSDRLQLFYTPFYIHQYPIELCNVLGDRRLNRIFFTLAVTVVNCAGDSGKPVNELFRSYYKKKLSEGKTKKQALKCVMRRLVNIVYGMMKYKTEYREPAAEN